MLCTSLEFHVLVTLPLAVLSVPLTFLWPLAVATFSLSLAVCAAAAAQAELPKNQRHFCSRPLVALLFFLQPIVRGWARYKGRLSQHQTPPDALNLLQESFDSAPAPDHALEVLHFWTRQPADRVGFINEVMNRLDRQGWTSKADVGWDNFDLEILGNRWSRLRLTTVQEALPDQEFIVHCRLQPAWSLTALVLFWSVLAAQLLLIGLTADREPWIWMILLSMPILGWFLEAENRHLQRLITAFLDRLARDHQFKRVQPDPPSGGNAKS